MNKKGTDFIHYVFYAVLIIAILLFIYFALLKPALSTGTTIIGELG